MIKDYETTMIRPKHHNQKIRVLQYIDRYGSINPMQAFTDLGITKLATRISELSSDYGYEFVKTRVKSKNRFGEPCCYMEYSIKK